MLARQDSVNKNEFNKQNNERLKITSGGSSNIGAKNSKCCK